MLRTKMRKLSFLNKVACMAASAIAMALAGQVQAHAADDSTNRALMQDFAHILYEQKQPRAAFEAHAISNLIQHNPNVADGRESAIREWEGLTKDPEAQFDVQRIVVDDNYAVVHFRGTARKGQGSVAVMELFRLKDGKIVEAWETFQMIPLDLVSKNKHPFF